MNQSMSSSLRTQHVHHTPQGHISTPSTTDDNGRQRDDLPPLRNINIISLYERYLVTVNVMTCGLMTNLGALALVLSSYSSLICHCTAGWLLYTGCMYKLADFIVNLFSLYLIAGAVIETAIVSRSFTSRANCP